MAMFVRSPHKNTGAETDRAPIAAPVELGSDLDKQAIKAMIERKRQNDLIRRREFAHLRKLRSKDGGATKGVAAAPSCFQSSFVPSDLMGRADTLKKIDEIEAQMSKQWWKGKTEEARTQAATASLAKPPVAARKFDLPNVAGHLQNTIGIKAGINFVPTVKSNEFGETDAHSSLHHPTTHPAKDDTDFLSTLKEFPPGHHVTPAPHAALGEPMEVDAVLEEAAMRFANGDERGAESGLLAALRQPRTTEKSAKSWLAALLDIYRTTHNQVGFFGSITEFARYLGGTEPQWEAIGGMLPTLKPTRAGGAIWSAPTHLDAAAMEELRSAMYSNPMPWHLDWRALHHIADDAMPQLAGLFHSLCRESVTLSFSGAHVLIECLHTMMVTGDKSIHPDWWLMRLNVLRVTQMMDAFEAVALDYCVTYEVSPPSWEKARCEYSNVEDSPIDTTPPPILSDAKGPSRDVIPTIELRGILLGDAAELVLANYIPDEAMLGLPITVSCHHLVRVDFSSAGSILNWAAQRQGEGSLVQFRDVHYLVAIFFHVIGIHEHARIVPREL